MPTKCASPFRVQPVESTPKTAIHVICLSNGLPYALQTVASKLPVATPQHNDLGLAAQLALLRDELRDGRLVQARQRNQLKHESAYISSLEKELQTVEHTRECLRIDIKNERNATLAAEKKIKVIAINYAKALDRYTRKVTQAKGLRLNNQGLGRELDQQTGLLVRAVSLLKRATGQEEQAEPTEAAIYLDQMEAQLEQILAERDGEVESIQGELDHSNVKIQRLERDLKRQREINALFSIDYDRETGFTKELIVPKRTSLPASTWLAVGPSGSRSPLVDTEGNQSRKRSRSAYDSSNMSGYPPFKSSKLDVFDEGYKAEVQTPDEHESHIGRAGSSKSNDSDASTSKDQERNTQLPTPDSSVRLGKRH